MAKGRGYSGAYRDSKDRIRPITPRKRSKAKTGVPISIKARNPRVNGRLPKGASMSDIITIEGVSKTRRAWLTDLSLETKINYSSPTQAWRLDHNRTDTIHIDNPESSRRRKKLREGGGKKKRTAKKAPKKPPKSRKKEGVGTIEHDGAVWKWDYQRKEWMLANFGGTLKGKTKKKAKKEPPKKKVAAKPTVKSEREAIITHTSQSTGGSYGEALHDVWITVDGKHYYIPSVPGNTIELNKNRDSLRDLIKLSGTERRERSIGSKSIKGKKTASPKAQSERGASTAKIETTIKASSNDLAELHLVPFRARTSDYVLYRINGKWVKKSGEPISKTEMREIIKGYHRSGGHVDVRYPNRISRGGPSNSVVRDIHQLNSGTISNLTGSKKYEVLDNERIGFAKWTETKMKEGKRFDTWQDAWTAFDGGTKYSKSDIVYAKDKTEAKVKTSSKGEVMGVESLGKNHMGDPYFRVIYIPKAKVPMPRDKKFGRINPDRMYMAAPSRAKAITIMSDNLGGRDLEVSDLRFDGWIGEKGMWSVVVKRRG